MPPSDTIVPTPVAVKKAGMPAPPARSRSARVPCGVSSTSISPLRYWRPNSLFSPMYDAMTRRMRLLLRSSPSPQPSTPQLLETTSRPPVPWSRRAVMRAMGTPTRPNPPTARDEPSVMRETASAAEAQVLSIGCGPFWRRDGVNLLVVLCEAVVLRACWGRADDRPGAFQLGKRCLARLLGHARDEVGEDGHAETRLESVGCRREHAMVGGDAGDIDLGHAAGCERLGNRLTGIRRSLEDRIGGHALPL